MSGFRIIALLLICCTSGFAHSASGPVVQTEYGKVQGFYNGAGVNCTGCIGFCNVYTVIISSKWDLDLEFRGIQFGRSVSGENRWKDAIHPESWSGVKQAVSNPPACPQNCNRGAGPCTEDFGIEQDEECLYLNVFAPVNATHLPVLVFIYGGAFIYGYSAFPLYDGSHLANNSGIVVVTINYRLGVLGYLVNGDGADAAYGNYGIKDQIMAFEWVQENIAAFGGDPDRVTISGESAGAMSVAIHITSEKFIQKPLFHQAILESDPFGILYMTIEEEKTKGYEFQITTGCLFDGMDCLRTLSVSDILKYQEMELAQNSINAWTGLKWGPNIDKSVLTDQPVNLIEKGQFMQIPMIMGTTSYEGILFMLQIVAEFDKLHLCEKEPKGCLEFFVDNMFDSYQDDIIALYTPANTSSWTSAVPQLSDIYGDYGFVCPTLLSARTVSQKASKESDSDIYSYIFNHPLPGNTSFFEPQQCKTHACHGSELPYVFYTYEDQFTKEERQLADITSSYWGSFVKTGNPNMQNKKFSWPSFSAETNWMSLVMQIPSFNTSSNYRQVYCELMDKVGYGNAV